MRKITSNNKVLFINIGWEQASYIDLLDSLGCEIYAISNIQYPNDPRIKDVLICDFFDVERIINFALTNKIDAVITDQCDYSLYAAAVTSEILGCHGAGIEQALLTTNKLLQRDRVHNSAFNILQPQYALCLSPEKAKQFCHHVGYPIILKPVDSRGSFGVSKVSCESEINNAFVSALNNSPARQVIIEKFIDGTQITIDAYADPIEGIKSLALATKVMVDQQTQVSIGINYPGSLDKLTYQKAMSNNEIVAKSLGIKFGMIHAEYMIDANNDIYLIEIANRGGGCFTSTDILQSVTGIDFSKKLITDSLGINNNINYKKIAANKTNLLFFKVPGEGIINSITLTEQIDKLNGLINYKVMINAGDKVKQTSNDANRHGFIIVTDDSKSSVVEQALLCFEFEMLDGRIINPVLY